MRRRLWNAASTRRLFLPWRLEAGLALVRAPARRAGHVTVRGHAHCHLTWSRGTMCKTRWRKERSGVALGLLEGGGSWTFFPCGSLFPIAGIAWRSSHLSAIMSSKPLWWFNFSIKKRGFSLVGIESLVQSQASFLDRERREVNLIYRVPMIHFTVAK